MSLIPEPLMTQQTLGLDPQLQQYLQQVGLREPEILAQLRQDTAQHPQSRMQIAPEQGQLLALLVQLIGAQNTLELGVFTGYSTLTVALALPPQGRIIACDIDPHSTAIARQYWQKAGVDHKIDLRLAPALQTLDELLLQGNAESFDFALIDADKRATAAYYDRVLQLVRPGGLIAIDNVLWSGRVADPQEQDKRTQAIRDVNQNLHADRRITLSLLAIGDGMTLIRKNDPEPET